MLLSETLVYDNKDASEFIIPRLSLSLLHRSRIAYAQGIAVYPIMISPSLSAVVMSSYVIKCTANITISMPPVVIRIQISMILLYNNCTYDCGLENIVIQSSHWKASFIICGGFNAHHGDWHRSQYTGHHGQSVVEFSTASGCDQLIDEATHISGNIVDLVLTDVSGIADFMWESLWVLLTTAFLAWSWETTSLILTLPIKDLFHRSSVRTGPLFEWTAVLMTVLLL